MENFRAFTLKSSCLLNMLKTEALVLSRIRDNAKEYTPKLWRGLWDTGASGSSINQRIVDDLSLLPVGRTHISTANGIVPVDTYLVDIGLPNGVTVKDVLVSCCNLGDDIDILIGMDIIRHGDFSITNTNNGTTFSFRIPSIKEIDYVKEFNEQQAERKPSLDKKIENAEKRRTKPTSNASGFDSDGKPSPEKTKETER